MNIYFFIRKIVVWRYIFRVALSTVYLKRNKIPKRFIMTFWSKLKCDINILLQNFLNYSVMTQRYFFIIKRIPGMNLFFMKPRRHRFFTARTCVCMSSNVEILDIILHQNYVGWTQPTFDFRWLILSQSVKFYVQWTLLVWATFSKLMKRSVSLATQTLANPLHGVNIVYSLQNSVQMVSTIVRIPYYFLPRHCKCFKLFSSSRVP